MKLSEAFVKSLADQRLAFAEVIPGEDAILLPFVGPRIDNGPMGHIRVDVDCNVLYHVYCSDPATVRAYEALNQTDIDLPALLEVFDVQWCPENDHLQAQGLHTVAAAALTAWQMVELAAALQGAAFAFTDWSPDTADERRAIQAAFHVGRQARGGGKTGRRT
jgi:hypothetical protein